MRFYEELISNCLQEAKPLLASHYAEIAHFKQIPLDPDYDQYLELEKIGMTRCFVARNKNGDMIGYAVYFCRHNLHYKSSLQAVQDILYMSPEYRGRGALFIMWCDERLKSEGVQVVYHHVKVAHDFSPMLEKIGYVFVDKIMGRVL